MGGASGQLAGSAAVHDRLSLRQSAGVRDGSKADVPWEETNNVDERVRAALF